MGRRLELLGFDRFAYLAVRTSEGLEIPFVLTTYPEEWCVYYGARDYVNFDPVMVTSAQTLLPFEWTGLGDKRKSSEKQREVLNHATEFGIKNGITVPIHGPGGAMAALSVTADSTEQEFRKLWKHARHDLLVMGLYYHSSIEKQITSTSLPKLRLTDRERECLLWTSRGKTAWEASEILCISEETVVFHLKNVMRKIGVFSKHHAVVKAILMGLIHP